MTGNEKLAMTTLINVCALMKWKIFLVDQPNDEKLGGMIIGDDEYIRSFIEDGVKGNVWEPPINGAPDDINE